jgi:hypothetical protein
MVNGAGVRLTHGPANPSAENPLGCSWSHSNTAAFTSPSGRILRNVSTFFLRREGNTAKHVNRLQLNDCYICVRFNPLKSKSESESEWLYDWRFTANQFVLAPSPLRFTTRDFFATEPLRLYSICNILSDKKMGLSVMNMLGLSSSVCIARIACYWKLLLLYFTQVLCQSRFCKADHVCATYLMLQRQLSHLNGRELELKDWVYFK